MAHTPVTGQAALAAGWDWLATLPRRITAHAERGSDPQAAVARLLAALGDPQAGLQVIHIAGSKGKGSTALFVEALLRGCGQSTFTYTSPHLQRWSERLRIDAREADPATALRAIEAVRWAQRETGIEPGFFEALTVAGLWLAGDHGPDWTIVEAGVGGRADATNVVRPRATLITGIEREHTDRLGDSPRAIAQEKSGIVKPGAPLLAPALDPAIDAVLAAAAARAGSRFVRLHQCTDPVHDHARAARVDWHHDGETLSIAGRHWRVQTPFAYGGRPMAGNAALAVAVLAELGIATQPQLRRAAGRLAGLRLPGRMETLSVRPWIIIDGAHTRASAEALAAEIRRLRPRRLHLLLSIARGKEAGAVLAPLVPLADAISVTTADRDYSLPARDLAAIIRERCDGPPLQIEATPAAALARACGDANGTTLIVATGSIYLAGRIRDLLTPPSQ